MTGFEGAAVSQTEKDWLAFFFFCASRFVAESKRAWLVILATYDGDSQFPPALYGSVYSELGEADEALSLLILQAETDGERWYIIDSENKMSGPMIYWFYWECDWCSEACEKRSVDDVGRDSYWDALKRKTWSVSRLNGEQSFTWNRK